MLAWVMNLGFAAGPADAVVVGLAAESARIHRFNEPILKFSRFAFLLGVLRAFFTN